MKHPTTGPVVRGEKTREARYAEAITEYACQQGVDVVRAVMAVADAELNEVSAALHAYYTAASPAADGEHVHVCATCGQVWNGERWVQA